MMMINRKDITPVEKEQEDNIKVYKETPVGLTSPMQLVDKTSAPKFIDESTHAPNPHSIRERGFNSTADCKKS